MPTVAIPALIRKLADGAEQVTVPGETLGEVIANLEARHPGIKARLCEDDRLKPGIAVYINGILAHRTLRQPVDADTEIHFLPAIGGGT